jgi:hypothetical protein
MCVRNIKLCMFINIDLRCSEVQFARKQDEDGKLFLYLEL